MELSAREYSSKTLVEMACASLFLYQFRSGGVQRIY